MVDIIGAIIVFCLFMGVILIISGCHDYNEANRGMEIGIGISLILAPIVVTLTYLAEQSRGRLTGLMTWVSDVRFLSPQLILKKGGYNMF